jgi:hypothetical protein
MKTPRGRADEGPVLPRRAGLERAPLSKKFLNFNEISKYSAERLSILAHRRADIHRLGVIASGSANPALEGGSELARLCGLEMRKSTRSMMRWSTLCRIRSRKTVSGAREGWRPLAKRGETAPRILLPDRHEDLFLTAKNLTIIGNYAAFVERSAAKPTQHLDFGKPGKQQDEAE